MRIHRSNIAESATLHDKLSVIEPIQKRGDRLVPEKPTTEMLAAGCLAGGISVEHVWNIYQAMLKAVT